MNVKTLTVLFAILLPLLIGCGRGKGSHNAYPDDFKTMGDSSKIDWLAGKIPADSLARFILYSALGRNGDIRIDSLAIATNHAYEILSGDDLDLFSAQYDSTVESLPLDDKMQVYMLAGSEDPQKLGYKLGLEYMGCVRDGHKSVGEVEKELASFKKACGSDTATYRRFLIGFRTVLEVDKGKDVPQAIYEKFHNYE